MINTVSGIGDGTGADAPRRKVMLVEDDAAVRRSLQLLLQARGFDVRAYADGDALLDDRSVRDAVALVADYRMDGLDGLDILLKLRGVGWYGKALMITGFPTPELADRARSAGYDRIIEKPFRQGALADTMTALLAGRSSCSAA